MVDTIVLSCEPKKNDNCAFPLVKMKVVISKIKPNTTANVV